MSSEAAAKEKIKTPVTSPHIWLDERGVAWVGALNVKVIEVAGEWLAFGFSPQEMVEQHYGSPNLAETFAALSYYLDHKAEFDAQMARDAEMVARLRAENMDSPLRRRLRELGKLP